MQGNKGVFVVIGTVMAGWLGFVTLAQMTAEGLIPIGAIIRVGSLRILNASDAARGKAVGEVTVDNAPDGFTCDIDEQGNSNCEFEGQ